MKLGSLTARLPDRSREDNLQVAQRPLSPLLGA
jgi:hypothetical protein